MSSITSKLNGVNFCIIENTSSGKTVKLNLQPVVIATKKTLPKNKHHAVRCLLPEITKNTDIKSRARVMDGNAYKNSQ